MSNEPIFIATKSNNVVSFNALSYYAVKGAHSQVLPTDRFAATNYTDRGLIEPIHNPETLIGISEINTWHNKCCDVKANDVAGLGYHLEGDEDKEVGSFFSDDARHGKPISSILVEAQRDFEQLGYLAMEVVRELYDPNGKPSTLAHIPGQTIRVHKDGNKYMQKRGTKERWFKAFGYEKDVDKDNGNESPLKSLDPQQRATEVIWEMGPSSRSDYYGLAPIIPAVGAVEGMRALRDYNIDFFRNHGVPAYAIYITGDYNLGKKKRVKLEDDGTGTLGEDYTGEEGQTASYFEYAIIAQIKQHLATLAQNPHSPLLIAVPGQTPESQVNIEFKPLAVEIKEASFRLYRKDNRDEIIVAHGVPAYRIGLVETGSLGGSTAVESNRIYRDSVIAPRKQRLASLMNVYIIRQGFQNKGTTFYFNDLDLAEETHEKEVAEFLFDRGAMRPVDLMKSFGEEFGLEIPTEKEQPHLYLYYMDGKPVDSLFSDDALEAIKSLSDELLRSN